MKIKKNSLVGFRQILGLFSLSTLLLTTSCSTDEATSTVLSGDNINDLSSKSVELSVNSNNLTASSSHSKYPAANAVDGRTATRWTGFGIGTTLVIDLEREDFIDYIKVAHYKGDQRKYSFSVYTKSSNSSEWNLVGTKKSTGNTNSLYTYDISNSTGRYIMIESNGNSSNNWSDIVELEVYGTEGEVVSENCTATVPGNRRASSIRTNTAVISWEAISNIDHYNVRYKNVDEDSWSYVYSLDTNSTNLEGLTQGEEYEWQIRVKCANGDATDYKDATSTFTTVRDLSAGEGEEEENGQEEGPESSPATGGTPESILGSVIKDWKITYPVDENGNDSASADDCDDRNREAYEQRDLTGSISNDYSNFFFVSGDEVVFKAHVGGATTSGSSYPRSEFRQLVGGGDNYWSMDEYQYLETRVRATHLPAEKPEVSMVQIHGPDDEPLRVEYRADKQGLHIVQNENTTVNDALDYELGQQLFVTVTVDNGNIALYILNEDTGETYRDNWEAEDSTGYFKVGCYTQSNNNLPTCKPGEGYSSQDADEYGEVRVKDLRLIETY